MAVMIRFTSKPAVGVLLLMMILRRLAVGVVEVQVPLHLACILFFGGGGGGAEGGCFLGCTPFCGIESLSCE